jgi:hypothetical protein
VDVGNNALLSSYGQGRGALATGYDQGNNALLSGYGQGRDALNANYGIAGDLYKNLLTSYAPGANAYGDATGANGAAGYTRATANFQTNPGYQFQLDQGQQALNRAHAAAGNLNSGNADADTLKFSQGLANQAYGQYTAGLLPYLTGQGNATQGAAGVATGQGNAINQSYTGQSNAINSNYGALGAGLNTNYGVQGAGLSSNYGTLGQGLSNIFSNEGQGINQSYMGQGGAANANYTGQGASNAAATMNNYNVGANQLNALTGGLNFLAGGAGGQGGAGGLVKNASSLFSAFV